MPDPKNILITGASSGIGEALAHDYAAPGVFLALGGRNAERLEKVANVCRLKGAEIETKTIDVTDAEGVRAWIEGVDGAHPLDLVVANAGVSGGRGVGGEGHEGATRIFQTNIQGTVNTVMPALERMVERPMPKHGLRGQIAIVSSLASFRGVPGAPAYGASKGAARLWGEALRGEMHKERIGVTVICPGFIRTRMTANNKFYMPMLMTADRAARIIRRGIGKDRSRVAFPFPLYFLVWFLGSLAPRFTDWMVRKSPKKE
jgi:short-subunit dehydrogenase